jgi:hypothetical protein
LYSACGTRTGSRGRLRRSTGFLERSVLLMQLDVFDLANWFVCDRVRGDCWLHLVDGRWISCLVRKTDRD